MIYTADTLQIRAGAKENMPTLADRELAYVRDEKALYIGTPLGNVKLCSADLEDTVKNRLDDMELVLEGYDEEIEGKLAATAAETQSELAEDADTAAIISAYNALIGAMKASGLMK